MDYRGDDQCCYNHRNSWPPAVVGAQYVVHPDVDLGSRSELLALFGAYLHDDRVRCYLYVVDYRVGGILRHWEPFTADDRQHCHAACGMFPAPSAIGLAYSPVKTNRPRPRF